MKRKQSALLWLSFLVLAGPWARTLHAAKYPPGQHWREISRGRFTIIFPALRFAEAEAALAAAEGLQEKLAGFWRAPALARTRIVLDDSTDQANGFATFFPFNLVGVNLAEPPPDSELAASRGWLDLVLAHELTHLFTLNATTDLGLALRRVFGSLPVLYSTAQMPPWALEGMAVFGESRFSGDGRLNRPPYRQMLAAARRDNLFPDWSRIDGLPAAWPGPAAKYLFGAGFMEFLAGKYGADRIRLYLDMVAARLLLISSSRDFENAFGEPLGKLWTEYRDSVPVAGGSAPEPLTKNGFLQQFPCPLGEDRLLYYRRDYQGRGEVAVLNLKTGQDKALFKMDAVSGLSVTENGKKILLSSVDNFHAFSEFSDLYEYDLEMGKLKRLSRGQRLAQPVKRENSSEIYCIQRRDSGYRIVVFDPQKREVRQLSRPFAGAAQPSISPDGSLVAAAVKPEGGPWGIGVFRSSGEACAFITLPGSDCRQPCWIDNLRFDYIQAGAETTHLAEFSIADHSGSFLDEPKLNGLQQFSISSADRTVFFTFPSGRGMEITRINLQDLDFFTEQKLSVLADIPEGASSPAKNSSRPYRPWRDLLPRWWSPALNQAGDELQAGVMSGGQDALAIHSYSLEGYYGFSSRRANFAFRYAYDGLLPTLSLAYGDSVEYFRGSRNSLRTQELKLASLWPLRLRKRSQLFAYADLHLQRLSAIYRHSQYEFPGIYNGFRLGLDFNSAREYYDSISPSDGLRFTVEGFIHPEGLGNQWANCSVQADLRGYIPLFRPGVLAWRLAAAASQDTGWEYYGMGGFQAESGLGNDQPFKLMRGFGARYFNGDGGWLVNLEYRLPLFKIEKSIMPSFSLDRVYMNTFFDMGRLASRLYGTEPVAYAVGAEAVLRLAFGGTVYTDMALGCAYGFGPEKRYVIYLRTGRSF